MTIQETIARLVARNDLSREEAAQAMRELMSGDATNAQTAAFLVALAMKGETVEEIAGLASTMRAFATRVPATRRPLVDTCGTGGDHSGTFNISTTAAFVVAGAGIAVAKHGNRSATSKCGSADVLEQLGVTIEATPECAGKCIDEIGIGFLFARTLHSAMGHVAPVRSELKVRTVFNVLGPLTNPAGADGQIIGVYDARLVTPLAEALLSLGARHAYVVHGCDGLDELTLSGPSNVAEARNGQVASYQVTPGQFGLPIAPKSAFLGGDATANARLLRDVLEGKLGPHRDIVLLNAAPAIVAGEGATDLRGGIEAAANAVDSGAALEKLEQLIRYSHGS